MHDEISGFFEQAVTAALAPLFVKIENIKFDPVAKIAWAKYNYMPGRTSSTVGGGSTRYTGLVQVTVSHPTDEGPGPCGANCKKIEDAFPPGSSFTVGGFRLQIDSVSRDLSSTDPLWYNVPVSIYWHLIKPN